MVKLKMVDSAENIIKIVFVNSACLIVNMIIIEELKSEDKTSLSALLVRG